MNRSRFPLISAHPRFAPCLLHLAVVTTLGAGVSVRAQSASAEDALKLKSQADLIPGLRQDGNIPAPTFAYGMRIEKRLDRYVTIERGDGVDAEVRKRNQVLKADRIDYDEAEDLVRARGNVRLVRGADTVTGPTLDMRLDEQTGTIPQADYFFGDKRVRGEAERLDFIGPSRYQLEKARYTTCARGDDDWYIKSREMTLDYPEEEGKALDATLYFKDVPILYTPWMTFGLGDNRRTGFLAPLYATSNTRGPEVGIPFYWNLAPNYDLLLTPRLSVKHGAQLGSQLRYIDPNFKGELQAELTPYDPVTKNLRGAFRWQHAQPITPIPGLSWRADVNYASDNTYFVDLGNRISAAGTQYLPQTLSVNYGGAWGGTGSYNLSANSFTYKTLQDPLAPVTPPYNQLPNLRFTATKLDWRGFDFTNVSEFVRFSHPTLVSGTRLVNNPQISYPLQNTWAFLIPKLQLHSTNYSLNALGLNQASSLSRTLPIASLDAGIVLERNANLLGFAKDAAYIQTLEPRAFYSYIPKRDQSNFPVFDSGAPDFNFGQIFSESVYSGADRFANTNQVTLATTTRLIDSTTGKEKLRFAVGQRFYFSAQDAVTTFPGEVARISRRSDYLAAFSGEIIPKLVFDSSLQYSPGKRQIERGSLGVSYRPAQFKSVSVAYRYNRNVIDTFTGKDLNQVDITGQWPITQVYGGILYTVGRWNYSLSERRAVDALAGVEFEAGCWVARAAIQRYATATQKFTTSAFFQIEFSDLGRLGVSPLEALRKNIGGYRRIGDPADRPAGPDYTFPRD